ncbi:MAG: SCO family protein [Magnetococcales bacterium]|nr:SCO family protein [Magnetococcales bacterium]MBF0583002.1 SCO family protein [Magnetococcales bacterium]
MTIFSRYTFYTLFLLLSLLSTTRVVRAETSPAAPLAFDTDVALRQSQDSLGRPLGAYKLRNRTGNVVSLSDFNGKPLLLSLVYTSCYHTCSVATRSLAGVVEKARAALGKDSFHVVTIGFDTQNDHPATMAHFARQQGLDKDENWFFLSGDRDTVQSLMQNVGFTAIPSPKGFDHTVQATVVDGNGVIYRQVYGETIQTPLLVEPLKDLVLGRPPTQQAESVVDNVVRRVRLFCTTYDPTRDGYRFDYSIFVGMFIGGMIILFASYHLFKEIRYAKKLGRY